MGGMVGLVPNHILQKMKRIFPRIFRSTFVGSLTNESVLKRILSCIVYTVLTLAALSVNSNLAIGQQVLGFDSYTGRVQASVPLWQVSAGPLSLPVTLSYSNNGVRTDQTMGPVGIGWHVSGAGSVTRSLRDIPDDLNDLNPSAMSRYGWLYGNSASKMSALYDANPSFTNCSDATARDIAAFGGNDENGDMFDLQPDIFRISVPGHLSVVFVFDENGVPIIQDLTELQITPVFNTNGSIESFVVIANGGIQYEFSLQTSTTIALQRKDGQDLSQTGGVLDYGDGDVALFRRDYFLYKPGLTYNNVWALDRITAPTGEQITINYEPTTTLILENDINWPSALASTERIETFHYNPTTQTHDPFTQYVVSRNSGHRHQLSSIETRWEQLTFKNNQIVLPAGEYDLKYPILTSLEVKDLHTGHLHTSYQFNYRPMRLATASSGSHVFLDGLEIKGFGHTYAQYHFNYYGITKERDYFKATLSSDVFGFRNPTDGTSSHRKLFIYPDINGSERYRSSPIVGYSGSAIETDGFTRRSVNPVELKMGALKSVTLPTGGMEQVYYEPNRYFDQQSGEDAYGGGLRVSKLRVHDGVSFEGDQTIEVNYNKNGHSSGKLVYRPVNHQRLPLHISPVDGTKTYYEDLVSSGLSNSEIILRTVMLTNQELNEDYFPGYTVGYTNTTVKSAGTGSSTTEFDLPVAMSEAHTINDALIASIPTPPTLPATCNIGLDQHDFPNYSYWAGLRFNGLPVKSEQRDESGSLVAEQTFNYSVIGTAKKIESIQLFTTDAKMPHDLTKVPTDEFLGLLYHPYAFDFGVSKVRSSGTSKTYDPSGNGTFTTSSSSLTRDTQGKVISSQSTDREGRQYLSKTSFADGFTMSRPTNEQDDMVKALAALKSKNQDVPIESVSILMINGVEHVTGAQLSIWALDDNGMPWPKSTWAFRTRDPVSNFTYATVTDNGTQEVFNYDSRYERLGTTTHRRADGLVISEEGDGANKQSFGYALDGRRVDLVVGGSLDQEIVFADFDELEIPARAVNASKPAGRIKGFSHALTSTSRLAYPFKVTSPARYILSFWTQSSSSSSLTAKILGNTVIQSVSKTVPPNGSDQWEYHRIRLDAIQGVNQDFILELSTSGSFFIDEVALYPEHSSFQYTHYGSNYRPIAVTDGFGNTSRTYYDFAGRVSHVTDHISEPCESSINLDQNFDRSVRFAANSITSNSTINPSADVSFVASGTIRLTNGFKASIGSKFRANIQPGVCASGVLKEQIISKSEYSTVSGNTSIAPSFQIPSSIIVNESVDLKVRWAESCNNFKWKTAPATGLIMSQFLASVTNEPPGYPTTTRTFTTTGQHVIAVGMDCGGGWELLEPYVVNVKNATSLSVAISSDSPEFFDLCDPNLPTLVTLNVTTPSGSGSYEYVWRKATWANAGSDYRYTIGGIVGNNAATLTQGGLYVGKQAFRCQVTDTVTGEVITTEWVRFHGYFSDPNCTAQ